MAVRPLLRFAAATLVVIAASVSPLGAQIPERFENLQVLPRDIPRDTLVDIMRGFTAALGVRCTYCHLEREGTPPAGVARGLNLAFASDSLANKRIARAMMRMADSINTRFLASIPDRDSPPTDVTCMTCHRGMSKPMTIQQVILATTQRQGVDSAIARYRLLRSEMDAGRFDFREQPVTDAARQLSEDGRHDDAIKLLQMLQEFYPNSVNIDLQLAETFIAKGDRDAGIARLRAVLAKNPNDRRARQRLQQLGVQP